MKTWTSPRTSGAAFATTLRRERLPLRRYSVSVLIGGGIGMYYQVVSIPRQKVRAVRGIRVLFSMILRQPLVHFLVLGAAIFAFYGAAAQTSVSSSRDRITIAAGDIEQLRGIWERQWQ